MKDLKRMTAILLTLAIILTMCNIYALAEEETDGGPDFLNESVDPDKNIDKGLAQDITVEINGTLCEFDVPPQIINDRTMVPLRAIFEALNATVEWDDSTKTVTAVKDETTIQLTVGSSFAYVNDAENTLDSPAVILNSRTLVPIRFVSESLGAEVDWDNAARKVTITSSEDVAVSYDIVGVKAIGNDGNLPQDAIDGDYETRWSYEGVNAWIIFDLGEVKPLGYMGIAFYKGDERVTIFSIETSSDGMNYAPAATDITGEMTLDMIGVDLNGIQGRYVKFIGNGNSLNAWNSLTEVRIYPPRSDGKMILSGGTSTIQNFDANMTVEPPADVQAALNDLKSIYGDSVIEFLAGMYDEETSGFYYAVSGRDNNGFFPDVESTAQIFSALDRFKPAGKEIKDYYTPEMTKNIVSWVQNMQDPDDGYFYHDQWGKAINNNRRGRDLGWATSILGRFDAEPLYPTALQRLSDINQNDTQPEEDNTNSLPVYLQSENEFLEWIENLPWDTDPYSAGNTINANSSQIAAAGYRDTAIEYLNSIQNTETGLWGNGTNYYTVSGFMKLSILYTGANISINNIQKAFESTIEVCLSDEAPNQITFIYNPFVCLSSIRTMLLKSSADGMVPEWFTKGMEDNAVKIIKSAKAKLLVFKKSDGGFSYYPDKSSNQSQGAAVSLGLEESDVNATCIALNGVLTNLYGGLGYTFVSPFDGDDFNYFWELVTGNVYSDKIENVAASAEIEENIDYGIYAEAVKTLFQFGILKEGSFIKSDEVNRAGFVSAAVKLLGIGDGLKPCDTVFSDVKADRSDSGAVEVAYDMGIISGFTDGTFRPDESMSNVQAVKVLLSILGYDVRAQSFGGYPSGYLTVASSIGLLKKVDLNNEKLTWENAAQLIFNALDVDLLQPESYPESGFHTKEGENVMTQYMDINLYEGNIVANSVTSIKTGNGLKDGYVTIGDMTFLENGTGASELLGYPVKAYYKTDDSEANFVLMSITVKNGVSELSVNAADIESSSIYDTNLVYYREGETKAYKAMISATPLFIYNGKLYDPEISLISYPKNGNVRLVDINNDSVYDIVSIESYEIYVVDSISGSSGIIKDLYSMPNLSLDPADTEMKCSIVKDGKPIELSKIKAGNVLSVAKSQDGKYVKVIVCNNKIKGDIQDLSDDSITVNGEKNIVVEANKSVLSKLKVGDNTTLLLTYDGLIAGFENVKVNGESYAYIYEGTYKQKGLNSGETADIRCFMADGSVRTLTTSKYFKYNDAMYDATGERLNGKYLIDNILSAYDYIIGKNVFKHQLVKIVIDDNGLLTGITTAVDNRIQANGTGKGIDAFSIDYSFHTATEADTYNLDFAGTRSNYRYITYKVVGILGNKYITSGCISINIPSDEAFKNYHKGLITLDDLEKQFSTFSTAQWLGDEQVFNIDIYDVNDENVIGVLVQFPYISGSGVNASAAGEEFFVVDRIADALDSEGYKVKKLFGIYKGANVGYVIDEEATAFKTYSDCQLLNLKTGDVVRIALDATNKITNILKIFTFDGTAPGANLYLLNGNQFDDIEARSDPRGFSTDQGYPAVNPKSTSLTAYKEKSFDNNGYPTIRTTWVSPHRAVHARFNKVLGKIAEVTFGARENGISPVNKLLSVNSIYVYDEKTDTVRIGTVADIDPNNTKQTAVIRMRHSAGYEILLVNRSKEPGTIYWVGNYDN